MHPNFVCYVWRVEVPAVCFSHQHAAQPANPDQYNPKPPVHRTSKAGLPSRSTGKRPRSWARSRNFRFAPSYLVTIMRPICVCDTCYITTAAYFRSDYARHYSISMCDGERCLSLPDILCKITVLEDGKEDWLELRKRRALMCRFAKNS